MGSQNKGTLKFLVCYWFLLAYQLKGAHHAEKLLHGNSMHMLIEGFEAIGMDNLMCLRTHLLVNVCDFGAVLGSTMEA